MGVFDFSPESFPSMLRNPSFLAAAAASTGPLNIHPPAMKKPRKSAEPRPRGGSPTKDPSKKLKAKSAPPPHPPTNNNYGDDPEGGDLKIDEDADPGKENLENKMETDDIAEIADSNGVSEEEEEPSMPGPQGELSEVSSNLNILTNF